MKDFVVDRENTGVLFGNTSHLRQMNIDRQRKQASLYANDATEQR